MFSRPITRAARSAPTKSVAPSAVALRAATTQAPRSAHQRRHSSSKTSHPPGTSPPSVAATNNNTTTSAEQSESSKIGDSDKKPATRLSRRKAKDPNAAAERAATRATDEVFANLPAVAPTNHLQTADVHTSAFFSMHRPISVTHPFPPEASHKAFDSIFDTRQHKLKDVVYTVSSSLSALDMDGPSREEKDLRWEILQQSSSNSDNPHVRQLERRQSPSLEELVKQFKPFNVPPAPVPFEDDPVEPDTRHVKTHSEQHQKPSAKHFTTTLTITEHTLPTGKQEYSASTTPFVQHKASPVTSRQPFLSRMQARQDEMDDYWDRRAEGHGGVMYAISVKRQRKLKMKKHKYKKLMRRTRNLRRREGRT